MVIVSLLRSAIVKTRCYQVGKRGDLPLVRHVNVPLVRHVNVPLESSFCNDHSSLSVKMDN